MREIKFKAWDKATNRMKPCEILTNEFNIYIPSNSDIELLQYIGLKDSNNTEIYEGDIVKIEDYFGEDIIGNIVYDEKTAGFVFKSGNEKNYFQMTLDLESYVYYVVGNIYENPELLKKIRREEL